jgi:hypothetical protein
VLLMMGKDLRLVFLGRRRAWTMCGSLRCWPLSFPEIGPALAACLRFLVR